MEIKKKPAYNIYKNAEKPPKLFFKSEKILSLNSPRLKTSHTNNSKLNMKIIDKKYTSKRDEILSKNRNYQSPNHSKKINTNKEIISTENTAQNLFDFTYPHMNKKDKEGLIVDLYHVSNEIDEQNNKLEELHQEYKDLVSNSLAYKIIIEKILGLDENGNSIEKSENENNKVNNKENSVNNNKNANNIYNKIKEKNKSENNLKMTNKVINDNKEYLPTVTSLGNNTINNNLINQFKSKKNRLQIKNVFSNEKENETKLNVLSRENNILSKKLIEKEKKLTKLKNREKIKNFEESVEKLKLKNNELEELVNNSNILQIEKFELDKKINAYNNKIKKFCDEINTITDKNKYNKKELENAKEDVQYLQKCIDDLKAKEMILNDEEKQNYYDYQEKIEKENEINNLLEEKKIFFEEKQKLDAQNLDLQKQEKNLAKTIEKKNLYIKSYEKENENLLLAIEDYESRRDKLLERADQPRKNKQRMKDIENEIKILGENIIKYKIEGEEKENNMEDNLNKNKELLENQKKEIEGHDSIIKDLENQINNTKNGIKEGEEKLIKNDENLNKLNEEYNKKEEEYKIEKENKEKEKAEKEEQNKNDEINKNKQNEEKINELIKNKNELTVECEKLKVENDKIKEENENIKKLHQEKFDKYKSVNEKMAKLNKMLNEIKSLNSK